MTTHWLRWLFLIVFINQGISLVPPKFQWKSIDFAWESEEARNSAIEKADYIPENVMPTGVVRWKNKLFITIPRWEKGVPASLNYIYTNGSQDQPLHPYPSWSDAFLPGKACCASNLTVVCAFRPYVDECDRLWVVDNGVSDVTGEPRQISDPAIFVFDLHTDTLLHKYVLPDNVTQHSSVFTSIVVDVIGKCKEDKKSKAKIRDRFHTFAYITDMGSNALVVYSMKDDDSWRVENPYFHFDPHAQVFRVGGVDFYWSDGISSAALSRKNSNGFRDVYFHPTSSTKQFKISTKLLRNKTAAPDEIFSGIQVIGDRGPMSQATSCDLDLQNNVLFYTQLSKNGIGCWNTDKPFNAENTPVLLEDCNLMEFPNDIKVDQENNIWILSNRQSRFLTGKMDFQQVNFRVLTAPIPEFIKGTPCEKQSAFCRVFSCKKRASSKTSVNK